MRFTVRILTDELYEFRDVWKLEIVNSTLCIFRVDEPPKFAPVESIRHIDVFWVR